MVSKEDFYKVWENPINALNQFYYEHYELLEAKEKIDKAIEYIQYHKEYLERLDKKGAYFSTIEMRLCDNLLKILGDKENE